MLQMPLRTDVSSVGIFSNEFNLAVISDTDATFMIVSDNRRSSDIEEFSQVRMCRIAEKLRSTIATVNWQCHHVYEVDRIMVVVANFFYKSLIYDSATARNAH